MNLPRDGFLFPGERAFVCPGCGTAYDSRGWVIHRGRHK